MTLFVHRHWLHCNPCTNIIIPTSTDDTSPAALLAHVRSDAFGSWLAGDAMAPNEEIQAVRDRYRTQTYTARRRKIDGMTKLEFLHYAKYYWGVEGCVTKAEAERKVERMAGPSWS